MEVVQRALPWCLSLILVAQITFVAPPWTVSITPLVSGELTKADVTAAEVVTLTPIPARLAGSATEPKDSLVFVGDVLLARNVEVLMNRHGLEYPLRHFSPADFAPNPYVVGNFEASVPSIHTLTPSGSMTFSVASTTAQVLSGTFSLLSLGNNHSLDYGLEGSLHTTKTLAELGMLTVGSGNQVASTSVQVVDISGETVAIIALNALVPLKEAELRRVFTIANRKADRQIVYVHWGEEYDLVQNEPERALAKKFVSLGADLIIGHHPHVTQGVETVDGVLVFYSLGNFLFDQYFSADVQEGLVLVVEFGDTPQVVLEPFTSLHALSQPRPMTPPERATYLDALAARSDSALTKGLKAAQLPLFSRFATSPKTAMISQ